MNTQRWRFQTINSGMLLKMGIVLSLLFMSLYVQAKTDKIKYHKYLIYTGDVLEKQPSGKGSLVLLNPENKEQTLMQITGSFIKNTIKDGVLTFPFKQGISFKGTIIADIVENNGVSLSMKLNGELSNVNGNIKIGTNDIKSVTVNDLDMYCELEKKSKAWIFTLGSNRTESIEKEVILNDIFTLPNLLASFDYSFSDLRAVKTHVNIDFNKIKPTDGVITYEFTDGATYKEPHLNYPNGDMITVDLKKILKSKGTRMIANGIKLISNGENDCELIYPNGDKYQGTIMGKAVYLMGRDASTKTVTYKDGVFTSGNKTEKWQNGKRVDNDGTTGIAFSLDDWAQDKFNLSSVIKEGDFYLGDYFSIKLNYKLYSLSDNEVYCQIFYLDNLFTEYRLNVPSSKIDSFTPKNSYIYIEDTNDLYLIGKQILQIGINYNVDDKVFEWASSFLEKAERLGMKKAVIPIADYFYRRDHYSDDWIKAYHLYKKVADTEKDGYSTYMAYLCFKDKGWDLVDDKSTLPKERMRLLNLAISRGSKAAVQEKARVLKEEKQAKINSAKAQAENKKKAEYNRKHPTYRAKCEYCWGLGKHPLNLSQMCYFCNGRGWVIKRR